MLLDTPDCEPGKEALRFHLSDASGKTVRFDDVMGKNGLVVAFICNHCPYVIAIIDRFAEDAKSLRAEGIGTVAIMSNDYRNYQDDRPEMMLRFAAQHKMDFPYLVDETQEVAKAYGAVCTPDFFGLDARGRFRYRGRLDDARMGDATHRNAELMTAMQQIARTGKGPEQQLPSMGCSIKWRA